MPAGVRAVREDPAEDRDGGASVHRDRACRAPGRVAVRGARRRAELGGEDAVPGQRDRAAVAARNAVAVAVAAERLDLVDGERAGGRDRDAVGGRAVAGAVGAVAAVGEELADGDRRARDDDRARPGGRGRIRVRARGQDVAGDDRPAARERHVAASRRAERRRAGGPSRVDVVGDRDGGAARDADVPGIARRADGGRARARVDTADADIATAQGDVSAAATRAVAPVRVHVPVDAERAVRRGDVDPARGDDGRIAAGGVDVAGQGDARPVDRDRCARRIHGGLVVGRAEGDRPGRRDRDRPRAAAHRAGRVDAPGHRHRRSGERERPTGARRSGAGRQADPAADVDLASRLHREVAADRAGRIAGALHEAGSECRPRREVDVVGDDGRVSREAQGGAVADVHVVVLDGARDGGGVRSEDDQVGGLCCTGPASVAPMSTAMTAKRRTRALVDRCKPFPPKNEEAPGDLPALLVDDRQTTPR